MQKILKFLVTFVVLSLPAFASAQLPRANPGEMLQLRSDDPRCDADHTCFMVGEYRRGGVTRTFERMLAVVNRGVAEDQRVTIAQLEAHNQCLVMYVRDGRPSAANGICDRNETTERVTFESFCGGDASCTRWPYANRVYRVPSVRILTPDERAEEMAREIANAVVTETVPAPSTLGANLRELIELRRSAQPPSDEHEVAALTAMADALDRTSASASAEASPDMVFDHAETVAGTEEPDALVVANARIAELEAELATRPAATSTTSHWIAIVILGLLLFGAIMLIVFGKSRTIDLTDSQRNLAVLNARKEFEKKLGGTIDDVKDKIEGLERRLGTAEAWKKSILEVFEKATGKSQATVNEIGNWIKGSQEFSATWSVYLTKLTPEKFRDERIEAAEYRKFREEWTTTPHFNLAFNLDNLTQVIAGWMRFGQLQTMWAGLVPAYAVDASASDGGLQTFLKGQIDEAIRGPVQQRQAAEDEAARLRQELEAERSKPTGFSLDSLRNMLHEIDAGELGSVLKREGRERVIDAEKVQRRFSTKRTFEKKGRRGQPTERQDIFELNALSLNDFLRTIHEDFSKALRLVDQMLGRSPDLTPPPGSVAIPTGQPDPRPRDEEAPVEEPSTERPEGLGTADLAEQDEGETSEMSPEAQAVAAAEAINRRAAEIPQREEEEVDESDLPRDETVMAMRPLGPESTHPFGPGISVRPVAGNGNGADDEDDHGSNGKGRDDDATTKVVHADAVRGRRDTMRGIPAMGPPTGDPEPDPVRAPTDPPPAGE